MSGKREKLDPTPRTATIKMAPIGQNKLDELMHHLGLKAAEQEHETLEEADDFDVGDDYDPTSPWEENFHPDGSSAGFLSTGVREYKPQGGEDPAHAPDPKEGDDPPAETSAD